MFLALSNPTGDGTNVVVLSCIGSSQANCFHWRISFFFFFFSYKKKTQLKVSCKATSEA